ncbi:rna-directed dna polymerase from mobile element jockey-like [Pitangus sulphuratus]|nr:rna-directed dna polymerase from mobile element jockey-like [Pitangus sulphuratus]
MLRPVLFKIFANNSDSGIECIFSKFANNIKMTGVIDMPERWDAVQRDLDNLKKWAHGTLMRFNKAKCKEFQMG